MPKERSRTSVVAVGWSCLVAGVVGAAAALFLVLVEPAVAEDRYSYPLTAGGFAAIQVFFFVHHLGLLAGLYGLWRSGAVGTSRLGRWGAWGAVLGMALLTVTELIAITGSDSAYPSPRTNMLDGFYGVSSVLIGVTMIMTGGAVMRTNVWRDWRRYVPLLLGVYVFVPMTPALFGPFVLARFAIGGWMLGFALLGWAVVKTGQDGAVDGGGDHLKGPARGTHSAQSLTSSGSY